MVRMLKANVFGMVFAFCLTMVILLVEGTSVVVALGAALASAVLGLGLGTVLFVIMRSRDRQ